MNPNLLPLSVGLTLIHWSRDHELLARSRPGALWSICRIALLIVGIHGAHSLLSRDHSPLHTGLKFDCHQLPPSPSLLPGFISGFTFPLSSALPPLSLSLSLCRTFIVFLFLSARWVSGRRMTSQPLPDTEERDNASGYYLSDTTRIAGAPGGEFLCARAIWRKSQIKRGKAIRSNSHHCRSGFFPFCSCDF